MCQEALHAQEGSEAFNTFSYRSLPPLKVGCEQGIASPYAGKSGRWVVIGGGCNFPEAPLTEGGAKRYYSDIYALDTDHPTHWIKAGHMATASAYGVSIGVSDGVVWIGGNDGTHSLASAWRVSVDVRGKASLHPLPQLPIALDNMAGAMGGGYLYVAGGQSEGKPSNQVFRLKYPDGSSWERLPDMPGPARLQAVATVQSGASPTPKLYVIGGYSPLGTNANALCYDPQTERWSAIAPIEIDGNAMAVAGAGCVNSGNSYIVCMGGVDKTIFDSALRISAKPQAQADSLQHDYLSHAPEWYRFRTAPLTYNTITDTWAQMPGNALLARAGAAVVGIDGTQGRQWVVVCGETKPGIRSAQATAVTVSNKTSFGWANWIILIAYLVGMLVLGYVFMHREKSANDFFTGGGRIPWWAAGISIFATIMSAITYMSIPAKAYATDWKYYPMQIMILVVAFPVIKYYLPFFRRLNVGTAYAYLEQRFSYAVRAMASVLFIVFMVARMALVLFLPSLAMSAVTDINIFACIMLMSAVTIVYCTMGGMEAVVWGDVVQGIILVGGAVFAAIYLVTQTQGGATAFFDIGMDDNKFVLFDWSFDYRTPTFWIIILGGLANNLISYTSDQTIIQRYMTTRNERSASRSILTNAVLQILVSIVFYTIGTGLYTFFKTHPASLDITMTKTDAIFPFFMMSQLPQGIAGLLIAALFAATMSTISSNINSISTAFTIDIYKKIRPLATERQTLGTARTTGVVAGAIGTAIALLMAVVDINSLLDYFNTILGMLTGSIGALFAMGIFFKRINATCALTGFVCGTATVFYMNYFTSVNFFLFGLTSMVVALVVALAMSLVMPNHKAIQGLTWQSRH